MNKFFKSSADPERVSATVKSVLIAIVPIVIALTDLTEADLNPLIESTVTVVFLGTALASAVGVLYGIGRKVYYKRWTAAE